MLTRDAWACRSCGKVSNANHADHIVPVMQGGDRYAIANGQTLCTSCHGRKTRREQNEAEKNKKAGASGEKSGGAGGGRDFPAAEGGSDHPGFAS